MATAQAYGSYLHWGQTALSALYGRVKCSAPGHGMATVQAYDGCLHQAQSATSIENRKDDANRHLTKRIKSALPLAPQC